MRRRPGGLAPASGRHPFRYVDTDAGLADLVAELASVERYGIDTEFHRERSYFPHLALLQVAWEGGIALVDPLRTDVTAFAEVLRGEGTAIVHAAGQDLEVLDRACGASPRRLFDTQLAAGFLGMSTPSLVTLVERLIGDRIEKGDQLTDWTRRPLTAEQQDYAAGDVAYLLELHRLLVERLAARGRLEWAEQECELMLARPRGPVTPEEAWWRLKQARQLRGRARSVAQSVAAWRERRAAATDQPTRFILSDLAIASIAQRPPRTRAELEGVRSVDGRHLAGTAGTELLDAIEAGIELPSRSVVLPPGPNGESVQKPAVALASAWATERARALDIDPAILATRADIINFLREPPVGRLVGTWRHSLVGEPIQRLVAGEASLALDSAGCLVLEERTKRALELGGGAPETNGADPPVADES